MTADSRVVPQSNATNHLLGHEEKAFVYPGGGKGEGKGGKREERGEAARLFESACIRTKWPNANRFLQQLIEIEMIALF